MVGRTSIGRIWIESEGIKTGEKAMFLENEHGGGRQFLTSNRAGKVGLRPLIRSLLVPTTNGQKCLMFIMGRSVHLQTFGGPPGSHHA
jgi:hypothetical protein